MTVQSWTLFDHSKNDHMGYQKLGTHGEFSVHKCGRSAGVEMVTVDNGSLAIHLLPTRGMSLWKAFHEGMDIGWTSPTRGPVHPNYVPLAEPSGLGWLEGFDELLVRCGPRGATELRSTTNAERCSIHCTARLETNPRTKSNINTTM